jgi:hypothetical protein
MAAIVQQAIEDDRAVLCGVVIYEVLQGIKNAKESQHVSVVLDALPCLEFTKHIWIRAALLSQKLRSQGITVPMSDILIAAIAAENKVAILTADKHFESMGVVKLFPV